MASPTSVSAPLLGPTSFSNFFRHASAEEKKRRYDQVLKSVAESQQRVIDKANIMLAESGAVDRQQLKP